MKKLLFAGVSFSLCLPVFSQRNTVATGGDASGSGGSVSYSVGQIDYSNYSGTNGSSNEGVQQPFEFFNPEAALDELDWNAELYPNPTNDQVILQLSGIPENGEYKLFDSKGSIVLDGSITDLETIIDMRSLTPAVYHLQLSQNTTTTSIQIVKN